MEPYQDSYFVPHKQYSVYATLFNPAFDEVPDVVLWPPLEDLVLGEGDVEERVQRLPRVVVALVQLLDRVRRDPVPVGNTVSS